MKGSENWIALLVSAVYVICTLLLLLKSDPLKSGNAIPSEDLFDEVKRTDTSSLASKQIRQSDGSFHGHPIYYTAKALRSEVRCVGDNFGGNSWYYQSCLFREMCYDLNTKEFVIYTDQEPMNRSDMYISTSPYNKTVSGAGQPAAWFVQASRGKFFPTIRKTQLEGYYRFPTDVVWLPYFPQSSCNPGHLVWDTFLPLYILMEIFDISHLQPLLFQMSHPPDSLYRKMLDDNMCPQNLEKFLPLMGIFNLSGVSNDTFVDAVFREKPKSSLVCSPTSAAGIGMLTDHGLNKHGQAREDYFKPHNLGRALLMRRFRAFALRNANISDIGLGANSTFILTFSTFSSGSPERMTSFVKQVDAISEAFEADHSMDIMIKQVLLREMTLNEQISLCTQSSIFVTTGGGGTVTATFLPKGATLIVFYHETEKDGFRVLMDWDLWNNYAEIKVHWLPIKSMDNTEDLQAFVELIKREIQILRETLGDVWKATNIA